LVKLVVRKLNVFWATGVVLCGSEHPRFDCRSTFATGLVTLNYWSIDRQLTLSFDFCVLLTQGRKRSPVKGLLIDFELFDFIVLLT
jgi:hypothetical protein